MLGYLRMIAVAGKPALLIEYPKSVEGRALSKKRAEEHGLIWLGTDRGLKTLGESGR